MDEKSRIEERSPLVSAEEFLDWILFEDQDLLVVNKPGWLVCHPSKNGPWSSLVGAGREHTRADRLYLAGRLDRETSGVVLLGKNPEVGKTWQMAVEKREAGRSYLAILTGELKNLETVETHIGNDPDSPVFVKQRVTQPSRKSKLAQTCFIPLIASKGHTLTKVTTQTGRKHQIRVHAQHIDHPLVGDKLYGDDENLYLEFCQNGWTNDLADALPMHRQALHSSSFGMKDGTSSFNAPMAADMEMFCLKEMAISPEQIKAAQGSALVI
jgi:23S rRNA pseudouridine1911/1915/1917 synthase